MSMVGGNRSVDEVVLNTAICREFSISDGSPACITVKPSREQIKTLQPYTRHLFSFSSRTDRLTLTFVPDSAYTGYGFIDLVIREFKWEADFRISVTFWDYNKRQRLTLTGPQYGYYHDEFGSDWRFTLSRSHLIESITITPLGGVYPVEGAISIGGILNDSFCQAQQPCSPKPPSITIDPACPLIGSVAELRATASDQDNCGSAPHVRSIQWASIPDGLVTPDPVSPGKAYFFVNEPGKYQVMATVTDNEGATAFSSVIYDVKPAEEFFPMSPPFRCGSDSEREVAQDSGRKLKVRCEGGSFSVLLVNKFTGDELHIGKCYYENGENYGRLWRCEDGTIAKIEWINEEGHKGIGVDSPHCDGDKDNKYDYDRYTYLVKLGSLIITHHERHVEDGYPIGEDLNSSLVFDGIGFPDAPSLSQWVDNWHNKNNQRYEKDCGSGNLLPRFAPVVYNVDENNGVEGGSLWELKVQIAGNGIVVSVNSEDSADIVAGRIISAINSDSALASREISAARINTIGDAYARFVVMGASEDDFYFSFEGPIGRRIGIIKSADFPRLRYRVNANQQILSWKNAAGHSNILESALLGQSQLRWEMVVGVEESLSAGSYLMSAEDSEGGRLYRLRLIK